MVSQSINYQKLDSYVKAFFIYELAEHGVDVHTTLDGTTLRISKDEGYKYCIKNLWKRKLREESGISKKIIEMLDYSDNNLLDYRNGDNLKKLITSENSNGIEDALFSLYYGDDDKTAFSRIVQLVGNLFDVLGFLFFLKDPKTYMPIRSEKFDNCFRTLDLESKLSGHCSWEKYQEYNQWIRCIRDYLVTNLNPSITLLDAHSFVWILPILSQYATGSIRFIKHYQYGIGSIIGFERDLVSIRFQDRTALFQTSTLFNSDKMELLHVDIYSGEILFTKASDVALEKNDQADDKLKRIINSKELNYHGGEARYRGGKIPARNENSKNNVSCPVRDPRTSFNALSIAGFRCEINPDHTTFISRATGHPYMESHHLVPMAYQKCYHYSIDREENIVCLCSNCHNNIHYGADAITIVEKLYNARKEHLKSIGVEITLEQLKKLYEL